MRKIRGFFFSLMVCLISTIMLCLSGCVIILSDKVVEKGENMGENLIESMQDFPMRFVKAGLVYGGDATNGCIILGRNGEGRRIEIPKMLEGIPVVQIKAGAFRDTNIITVVIGENISYIGSQAFYECEDLKKVTFEQKVGWTVNGQMIDSSSLEDPKDAAKLLKQGGCWKRY